MINRDCQKRITGGILSPENTVLFLILVMVLVLSVLLHGSAALTTSKMPFRFHEQYYVLGPRMKSP